MIEKLTQQQEALLSIYRDKWLTTGLSTERVDRQRCTSICRDFYTQVLKRAEPIVVFMPSPLTAWLAVVLLAKQNQVWDQVKSQVWSQVWSQVRDQVESQVWGQVRSQVGDLNHLISPYTWGMFDSGRFSFYDYVEQVLGIHFNVPQWPIYRNTSEMGPIWMLNRFCIISDRPTHIEMVNGRLHCDGGPAVKYLDGLSVWVLNGVCVSQQIAEMPANELDPRIILAEKNAEVRREIVRKIGIERICASLGAKCVDQSGDYQLLMLDLQDGRRRPYLKMLNPSIGTWHIEGVHPDCDTVEKAIAWRNGVEVGEFPAILT